MKKSLAFRSFTVLVFTAIFFIACSKETNTVDNNYQTNTTSIQIIPDNTVGYFDLGNINVTSTLDEKIQCSSPDLFDGPVTATPTSSNGFMFREILSKLNLTRDQIPVLQKAIGAYQECVNSVMTRTNAQRREILVAAEQKRQAIIARVKLAMQNETDRTKLAEIRKAGMDAINKLNLETRKALEALIDNSALCDCWNKLIRIVRATLSADQLKMFERWLSTQTTPCAKARIN